MHPAAQAAPGPLPSLLLVDVEAHVDAVLAGLRDRFRVAVAMSTSDAVEQIARRHPSFVIAALDLLDEPDASVCRAAKQLELPSTVLVTTAVPERVPAALAAGCDSVLLMPFAPNLLYSRLGRLVRERSRLLRARAARQRAKVDHLLDRPSSLKGGTNQAWANTHCPTCDHQGVTSFEFVSYRRAWYACSTCQSVWIAPRLEDR
jgi:DNA-binding response OmpR family regulator